MIFQQLVIFFFIFWIFEEYANNLYFQSYVNTALQGSGFVIIAGSCVGIFSAVAVGLYMRLRQTRMELDSLVSTEATQSHVAQDQGTGSSSILAPHQEQHLINMIRNSPPADSASASMPTLKREDPSGQAK
jgi:hypothetical protein